MDWAGLVADPVGGQRGQRKPRAPNYLDDQIVRTRNTMVRSVVKAANGLTEECWSRVDRVWSRFIYLMFIIDLEHAQYLLDGEFDQLGVAFKGRYLSYQEIIENILNY